MFIPRHLICESLRDGVLHTCLGALRWIFYILSEVSTSCCARRDSCARCSCLSSIFAGVGAEDGFFYITLKSMFSRIANHCQSHRTMYIGSTFPDLELLQPCFFSGCSFEVTKSIPTFLESHLRFTCFFGQCPTAAPKAIINKI